MDRPDLSIVIPLYNEAGTLVELHHRLARVLEAMTIRSEILFVDDGSQDATAELLTSLAALDPSIRVLRLARNFGQTAALAAGFDFARGGVIVAMDGDLQHAPEEIPKLVAKLDEGYDLVSGWRERRVDGYWTRRLPSRIANWLMAKLSGVPLRDFGTTFKAYRAPVIKRIRLHGDLHRFIPALASWDGARIAEVSISSAQRPFDQSHYGLSRTWKVMADLITVRYLLRYVTRPLHLFGPIGFGSFGVGMFVLVGLLAHKLVDGGDIFFAHGPLMLLGLLLVQTGVMLIGFGLMAELMTRIYMDGRERRIYTVAEIIPGSREELEV